MDVVSLVVDAIICFVAIVFVYCIYNSCSYSVAAGGQIAANRVRDIGGAEHHLINTQHSPTTRYSSHSLAAKEKSE